jgi:hypothetical protein
MSTDVSEVRATFIIRAMMEAARTSETSVDIDLTTQQYIPEDTELHVYAVETETAAGAISKLHCQQSIIIL